MGENVRKLTAQQIPPPTLTAARFKPTNPHKTLTTMPETKPPLLTQLQNIVGSQNVLQGLDATPYHTDERLRYHHPPIAVIRPQDTTQICAIVQLCADQNIALIAQGGNTGLVGGCAVLPDTPSIVLNLNALNRILSLDPLNQTITVQAGVTLAQVHDAAQAYNLMFPLTLASQDSATIGGNLATNAGGMQVLRYGTMRDLCMGIEVVLANGQTLSALNTLRKNNTGYDLKHLFIGSEGTLGIITAAVLKLYPAPQHREVALIACAHPEQLMHAFDRLRQHFNAQLTAFEYIAPEALDLVCAHLSCRHPWAHSNKTYHSALLEISHHIEYSEIEINAPTHPHPSLTHTLNALLTQGTIQDAIFANSLAQVQQLWQIRERISSAQKAQGPNIKHDISLPISAITAFISETGLLLEQHHPGIQPMVFGHIGDGNLHYNVSAGQAFKTGQELMQNEAAINALVYAQVHKHHGSISAEHGIGILKRDLMSSVKNPTELATMQLIKHALDPKNILNPHKVLPDSPTQTQSITPNARK